MFYQSRWALPISSLRLAKHSVEMSLVYPVKFKLVEAFIPGGVSVLNPEGGTSSSGSALLFSAWKSVNCPGGLRLGAGALILRVRHRLV